MNNIDWMQAFCGKDEYRPYLHKPFSRGQFSYATNGRIMVRIPRDQAIVESDKPDNVDVPLAGMDGETFSPAAVSLPPAPGLTGECKPCAGRGFMHDCPECTCECEDCRGSGEADPEIRVSTTLRGDDFGLNFVRLMLSLPGVQLSENHKRGEPLLFKFDGGDGAIMPRRGRCDDHIEVETSTLPDADGAPGK